MQMMDNRLNRYLKQTDTKQLKKGADKTFTDNLIKKNRRQVCTNTEKEWD